MKRPLALALALVGAAVARPCAAQSLAPAAAPRSAPRRRYPPPPPPVEPVVELAPAPARSWYGGYTLGFAGAAVLGGLGASFAGTPQIGLPLALGGLVLTGPIVHWAHGEGNRGFLALGLNLGGPLTAGLAGWGLTAAISQGRSDGLQLLGALAGASIGLLTAVIIDVAVFSYTEPPPRRARGRSHFTIAPDLRAGAQATTLGVAGTF